jgi:hypothetical protein
MAAPKRSPAASAMIPMTLPEPKLITVPYADFSKLAIDESYQRIKISDWVSKLIMMIRADGDTPPIVLNERPGDKNWYIVDGQQRYWSHVETQTGTKALLYKLKDLEEERKLYHILNYHRAINGDNVVKAWPGETGKIIRDWATLNGSPYWGNVSFDTNRSAAKYSAATLARAICAVVTPQPSVALGGLRRLLAQSDADMHLPGARERVEALMRLIPLVFPPRARLSMRVAVIFGRVAQQKWRYGVTGKFPSPAAQNKLRAVNWATLVPSTEPKYDIVIEKAIETRWK